MRYLISVAMLGMIFAGGLQAQAYASDWDVAGKVLTGIEGLRIITGGEVDIIGSITGINRKRTKEVVYEVKHDYYPSSHVHNRSCSRIWVPHYTLTRL